VYTAAAAPAVGAESNNFWQHTRMAGLLNGVATATAALPGTHAAGGILGVQSQVSAAGGSTFGMSGAVVCAGSVPWKMAISIDAQLDDGNSDTGNVRSGASTAAANVATTAAVAGANGYGPTVPATATLEAGMVTICMKL
jgi:hypothetical protein